MILKRLGIIMYQTSTSKGQELVAQRMTREFNKLGQNAYLITSLYHDDKSAVPPESLRSSPGYLYTEDSVLKIPVIRVDSYTAKWPPRRIIFRDFVHTLESIVDKFELNVLITHSTLWNGPEETAKLVVWRRDMRNLGGYQDPIVFCHMSHLQEASPVRYSLPELTFRTAWNKFSLSKIMETANLILVVTPLEKESTVKMGGKPGKCFLFPGGVDDEVFLHFAGEDSVDFRKRHNISPDTRLVSYLGTIEERKNPMAVLKVAEKLREKPNLHFILAGRGDSSYAEGVKEKALALPNVTYLGEIDEKEKIQLIKTSYLNILMSRLEALGISQLEFMYSGVPVITSATGGQSWVVQDGSEGWHVKGPDDIDGASNAIVQLLENDGKYSQMSANAQKKAANLTMTGLTKELDSAIETEMMKESGLAGIPEEVQATLVRPEYALKTWTFGTRGIVATNRRVFIRQGVLSRKVTELRYADIKSIEHARRYPWRTLLLGAVISAFLLVAPSLRPLLSSAFVTQIESWWQSISPLMPLLMQFLLPLLPLLVATFFFFFRARFGFRLHGIGIKPLYLPGRFKEAIGFIREKIDSSIS
ncbi:MAG: glycosyltransferase [Dehalococcoidales bacterium]|nr:glycosyltransferase [Dehalococcoidales bacterium]